MNLSPSFPAPRRALAVSIASAMLLFGVHTNAVASGFSAVHVDEVAASATGRYLVTFVEAGLSAYRGDVPGLARTAPVTAPLAVRKLDVNTQAAAAYSSWLAQRRGEHLASIERMLGRSVDVAFAYEVTRHGVSLALDEAEANRLAKLPGVLSVTPVQLLQATTYRGPRFIGADTLWDGSNVPTWSGASRGEGQRIGVIDTGVDATHPSFAADASCGVFTSPKITARDCTVNDGIHCIGGNSQPSPGLGHGMHVASTAAGSPVGADAIPAPMLPDDREISGVAPCASVISYRACVDGGCYGDALEAAVQHAIVDQVDVLNYSIGPTCGGGNPWADLPDFLPAFAADVFVAAAAGNTGAECIDPTGRVTNLSPWVTTVAASSTDELFATSLDVLGSGAVPVPDALARIPLVPGSTTLPPAQTEDRFNRPLRIAADNPTGCSASGGVPAGHFDDAIAVLRRGDCNFDEKIVNAVDAGADIVIVTNNSNVSFSMDTTGVPDGVAAFSVDDVTTGDALLAYAALDHHLPATPATVFSGSFEAFAPALADYRRSAEFHPQPDVLASFSLRGPTSAPFQNLPKPDVTAPGSDIYAAEDSASGDYGWMSGTSMASPHVAGAAVLLRAILPDWSVGEVKSALMTTAIPLGHKEDGTTPWDTDDVGSGRIDLTRAALAGLTLDETEANYRAANPALGQVDIRALNLPSLRNVRCGEGCSFVRTLRNRLDVDGHWDTHVDAVEGYSVSIEPASFSLAPGATQQITITATIADVTLPANLAYGRVWLRETGDLSPEQQLPLALRGDVRTVECASGYCSLRLDNFNAGYSAIGCDTEPCSMVWANRFSAPPTAFPITLTSVGFLTGSSTYVAAGDSYDIHIYQDDDRDPRNGATLAGSHTGYVVPATGAALRTVVLATPVVLDGPGDIVIALVRPTGTGPKPAAGELSEYKARSYIGHAVGGVPDLGDAAVDLQLTDDAIDSEVNWVIRGFGTTADGKAIRLGGKETDAAR